MLAPAAALDVSRVDLGDSFLTVPVERTVTIRNLTQLPAEFRWQQEVLGVPAGAITVAVSPAEGTLGPGESLALTARFVPLTLGRWAGIVACDVAGAARPIGFELVTEIKGLEVRRCAVPSRSCVLSRPASIMGARFVTRLQPMRFRQ